MFSISVFCGLSQSHCRLRGSERISGLTQIWVSILIGIQRSNLSCREHDRGLAEVGIKHVAKHASLAKDYEVTQQLDVRTVELGAAR